jgi:predicted transcriptional regulator
MGEVIYLLKLCEVQEILEAKVLCCGEIIGEVEVKNACGADLLSDVLAFTKEHTLLLTGMTNLQVIRTAEISDLNGVVFVRGKMPRQDVLQAAEERNIPVLLTDHTMYEACGRLYKNGLPGCARIEGALLNV